MPDSLRQTSRPAIRRDGDVVLLSGEWTLQSLRPRLRFLRFRVMELQRISLAWDLSAITRLDSFAALLLWNAWGRREPAALVLPGELQIAFDRIREAADYTPQVQARDWLSPVFRLGLRVQGFAREFLYFVGMLGQVVIEMLRLLRYPDRIPLREISATLYKAGATALPISAMLGFLIGLVLAYLMAFQLRSFGADSFIINILGIGITREIGPVLVAVLVAGRSGSAFTAQIGVMRVTEEIDALSAMGVSRHQRLVLPKVIALIIAMPLLVLWTSAAALAGGMLIAQLQLGIDALYFLEGLQRVVPVQNLYIGLSKGALFGAAVALIACHFGLRVKPNTESLSSKTTASVVASITIVIVINAVFSVLTRGVGIPMR